MTFALRIATSFQHSSIDRVLVVDDAYDPPPFTPSLAAPLLEILDQDDGPSLFLEAGLDNDQVTAVRKALESTEYDVPDLDTTVERLFSCFTETGESRFNPNGLFAVKEPNLEQIRPLVEFLRGLDNGADIKTIGLAEADACYDAFRPQLILLDYYLNSGSDPDPSPSDQARKASMDFLNRVVDHSTDAIPSVILMSKHDINDVDEYRHDAAPSIFALRFGFLSKHEILDATPSPLTATGEDVLLDASQGYKFGQLLKQALDLWHSSVLRALGDLGNAVRDLTLKDFAYLLRFRLRPEASGVTQYLDWLFGENLRGFTERRIPWHHQSLAALETNPGLENAIEGSHEGPTTAIANLYHRARLAHRQGRHEAEYRLGDIFQRIDSDDLRVVVSPDCDLVRRPKGPDRVLTAKVERILTMGGTLSDTSSEDALADELLLLDQEPKYVEWNPKDLTTFPVAGLGALHTSADFRYLGTFRPAFALSAQNRALVNLSRIGLPVPPALGVQAQVDVWNKLDDQPAVPFDPPLHGIATLVPRREGPELGHRVLLRRSFFNELVERLHQEQANKTLNPHLAELLTSSYEGFRGLLLVRGGVLNAKAKFKSSFILGNPNHTKDGSPLQFVLNLSSHAEDVLRVDPLN